MLSVLTFLLGFFKHFGHFPEQDEIRHCLILAGFDRQEIKEALDWLSQLTQEKEDGFCATSKSEAIRVYSPSERRRLPRSVRGFIQFLENEGILSIRQRELIISQLLTLPDDDINLQNAKLVGLLVLSRHQEELPSAVRERLLSTFHFEQTIQ